MMQNERWIELKKLFARMENDAKQSAVHGVASLVGFCRESFA